MTDMAENSKGKTIVGDLKAAAKQLEADAITAKTSNSLDGRWPYPHQKVEYDESRRLARRLREIAKIFTKKRG